ncbi:MAG: ABC transporter substrate-binding protein [Treponema sp.]|jgi:peptide/nickel transport system substrate-binding protein|nr:ABC transporter substrate-binding protein [Treponema sp.]
MLRHFCAVICAALCAALLAGCVRQEELTLEEIEARLAGVQLPLEGETPRPGEREARPAAARKALAGVVERPWTGAPWVQGRVGGLWRDTLASDPKSFNLHIAERDSATSGIMGMLQDWLFDYDVIAREWKPRAAAFTITVDEEAGTLDLLCTLRDDLYWSFYMRDEKIPVTSDDVLFWYNEIEGNAEFESSGYNGQFLLMQDGTPAHIDIEKIDDKRFVFHFPRIVAEPLLTTNRSLAPRYGYEDALRGGGVQAVLDLYSIETKPAALPSCGRYFLSHYEPGLWLVYSRNADYWEKDEAGTALPYIEQETLRIIQDENTNLLLFKQGDSEAYAPRPEDLDELTSKKNPDYTVFGSGGALSANFWTFNQNPARDHTAQYEWFTQKEFRQAMSCLLNRERIIAQVYRGLAEPQTGFFPEPNPFFNPNITLRYLYNPERALALLASIGMTRDGGGVLRDEQGRAVEFALTIRSESTIYSDIASIIMTELAQAGIKVNIRVIDFQKMVEQLFSTFEWDSMLMGLSGSNIFPTQGSNVWPSDGNLHLWYPSQESPATAWEARIDHLYNEGAYTIDKEKAQAIWDEYQAIILEQCPIIYLVRPRSFRALSSRWDLSNVYFDSINGFETTRIFLREE